MFVLMPIRRLSLILGCFAAIAATIFAAEPLADGSVSVAHVYTGWRDADSFKRISEYFNGRENTGGELILRTHPDQRGGYYFLARLLHSGAPVDTRIVLLVITPDSSAPKTFEFTTRLSSSATLLDLGLTGPDWPDPKIHAVAWKMDVFGADHKLLGTKKSYLWEKPSGE
jgi:hypothetical protein